MESLKNPHLVILNSFQRMNFELSTDFHFKKKTFKQNKSSKTSFLHNLSNAFAGSPATHWT